MVYQRRAQPRHRTGPGKSLLMIAAAIMLVSTGQTFDNAQYAELDAQEASESLELRHRQQPA